MSHSFCVNLTHFELMSHSSELTNLDRSANCDLKYPFRAPFTLQVVLVLLDAYPAAIWKISLKRGLSGSARANGALAWTSTVATFTSALVI